MITETLTWSGRINLWIRLGQTQVQSLKEASIYFRAIEKIRPTDEEKREIGFEQTAQGYRWNNLRENYGSRIFDFEDDEAEVMVKVLESENSPIPFNPADVEWMEPLIRNIKTSLPKQEVHSQVA